MKAKVLLIDDDKLLGQTVGDLLKSEGIKATVKENTKDLEQVIKTDKPEVIILDYWLGEEDGAEVAKQLKQKEETKEIPIIMVSSSYGIEKIVKESGAEAFLPKPFNTEKLLTTIQRLRARSKTKSN
jgi:DNA-binding response OmpR family regulator